MNYDDMTFDELYNSGEIDFASLSSSSFLQSFGVEPNFGFDDPQTVAVCDLW